MVKRIPVWLDEEMISDIGDIAKKEGMKNRSEFISIAHDDIDLYKNIFKRIFEVTNQINHYRMMMGNESEAYE